MSAIEQEINNLERQRFAAQVHKDSAQLEKLFADDLVYTHSNGLEHTKMEYINSVRDGSSRYGQIAIDAMNVRGYAAGATAVVNATITISFPDGSAPAFRLKYVTVHVRHPQHGWQVVLWQSQKQAA